MKKMKLILGLLLISVLTYCQPDKVFKTQITVPSIKYGDGTVQSTAGGGGSMVYPGAGIPLSTGTGWGTSITNNSTNWNTAFSWGNHAGLYRPISYVPTFASITGKPTTLAGYGITDAALATHNHDAVYKAIGYVPTWTEVTGKPTFSTVATTGSYTDLINRPATDNLDAAIAALSGITIPVLTATQITALTPVKGLLLYNDTDGVLQIYNGTVWKVLMSNQ